MSSITTAITGAGVHVPPNAVTNEELCASFNAWVQRENARRSAEIQEGTAEPLQESCPRFVAKVSGIRQRHFHDRTGVLDPSRMVPHIKDRGDDELSVQAEMALVAARSALQEAGRTGEDVDLVIVGASSLQRPYPAVAIEVQGALGARGFAYDISVGCSSGTFAVRLASESVAAGGARCALVITPELPSAYSNFRDRDSHFILGDAAAALVIEPVDRAGPGAYGIVSSACWSFYSNNVRNNGGFLNRCDTERRDDADKLFYQQGRKVFRDIVQLVPKLARSHLAEHGLEPSDVGRYWLHQANGPMNASITRRLLGEVPPTRAPMVLDRYGNTASAGALLSFAHGREDVAPGTYGLLYAFGAGYTVGGQLLMKL